MMIKQIDKERNTKMLRKTFFTASIVAILSGCATAPDDITASYVSPLKYKDYDCGQLVMEMDYVSQRTTTLYQNLDKKADNDSAQMGVGLILFWPALFFLEGGDGPEAQEYAQLKGEFEAIRTATVEKKCASDNLPKSPEEIIREKAEEEKKKQGDKSAQDI
ncbi:hypothetical protein NMS68_003444 [Vibrio cholerae]|nr:hypothetical protein [Vibrio cholerae]EJL6564064.1 hypothetical protein [Vibrio cholerae]